MSSGCLVSVPLLIRTEVLSRLHYYNPSNFNCFLKALSSNQVTLIVMVQLYIYIPYNLVLDAGNIEHLLDMT